MVTFPDADGISFDAGTTTLASYASTTFTPDVTGSTTPPTTLTFTTALGSYVKIGKLVHFQIELVTSAFTAGPAAGNINITGLPFASASTGINYQICAMNFDNLNIGASAINVVAGVADNSSVINILEGVDAGASAITAITTWTATTNVWISGTYEAAS